MDSYDRRRIEEMIQDSERRLHRNFEIVVGNQKLIADALNRIGDAVSALSAEVQAIRQDMNPTLDKPVKLPPPNKGL